MPTILVDDKPVELPEQPLIVLVHNEPMAIETPEHYEINSILTLEYIKNMKQVAWENISTSPLFNDLLDIIFPKADRQFELPESLEKFKKMDFALQHVAGMIILAFEALVVKKKTKLFFRNPENHLHPKQQQLLAGFLQALMTLGGGNGTAVAVEEKPTTPQEETDQPELDS